MTTPSRTYFAIGHEGTDFRWLYDTEHEARKAAQQHGYPVLERVDAISGTRTRLPIEHVTRPQVAT